MTTAWEPEQTVADNHGILLPHDLPEGVYQLVVGMYDIEDSEERLVVGGETAVSSTYSLGKISVGN